MTFFKFLLALGGLVLVLAVGVAVYDGPVKTYQVMVMDLQELEEVAFYSYNEWSDSHRDLARERLCEMWFGEAQEVSSWEEVHAAYERGQQVGGWCREDSVPVRADLMEKVVILCSTAEQCATALTFAEDRDEENLEWLAVERWKKFWPADVYRAGNAQDLLALAKACPPDLDCDQAVEKAIPLITTAEQAYDLRLATSDPDLRNALNARRCDLVLVAYSSLEELTDLHRNMVGDCPDKAKEVARVIERECLSFAKGQRPYTALAEARVHCSETSATLQISDLIDQEIARQVQEAADLQEALAVLENLYEVDVDRGREAIAQKFSLETSASQ